MQQWNYFGGTKGLTNHCCQRQNWWDFNKLIFLTRITIYKQKWRVFGLGFSCINIFLSCVYFNLAKKQYLFCWIVIQSSTRSFRKQILLLILRQISRIILFSNWFLEIVQFFFTELFYDWHVKVFSEISFCVLKCAVKKIVKCIFCTVGLKLFSSDIELSLNLKVCLYWRINV